MTDNPEFEKFFKASRPRLLNYVRRYVDSYEHACDIVQDSFYKLLVNYPDFKPEDGAALVYRITRNTCLDFLKKKKILRGVDLSFLESLAGEEFLYNYDFLGSPAQDECMYKELMSQLDILMERLPERCRMVFRMSRIENMSNVEIARKLGISQSAVSQHINKAVSILLNGLGNISSSPCVKTLLLMWIIQIYSQIN